MPGLIQAAYMPASNEKAHNMQRLMNDKVISRRSHIRPAVIVERPAVHGDAARNYITTSSYEVHHYIFPAPNAH
eukprot:scaffold477883_cov19-Prasinocladus_malaysianus.AAC.1